MRVSSNNGVWVEHVVAVENDTSEVLKVDLMDDTRAGRNDLEVVKSLGSPLEELEALTVTLEFELLVGLGSILSASNIDLDGVIDDEIDWAERVDLGGVSAETVHGVTHGSEIDDSGHATR